MSTTDNKIESVDILNEKLKTTEEKLNKILDLVYNTFTGNASAAKELSEIVGVPPPILCNEDEELSYRSKKLSQNTEKVSYKEGDSRLASRMEFLNQVMEDHDKMMKQNNNKVNERKMIQNSNLRGRVRSADRSFKGTEHNTFNPYTWNLNERTLLNDTNLYKTELSNVSGFCQAKPLTFKSTKSRPQTRQSNLSDMKVEQLLYNRENRRSLRSNGNILPDTQDYKLTYEGDVNIEKPPKPMRPTSSISHKRNPSARFKRKMNLQTPFHNLNLHPLDDDNDNTEKLLQAMEKRFQLSTIDLQRRLGIPEIGMVGP